MRYAEESQARHVQSRPARAAAPRRTAIINNQSSIINSQGFTLIELLVVISIIVLLISILLPSLQRVRKQAKAVVCQTRLHESGLYFAGYAAEYDGRLTMRSARAGESGHFHDFLYVVAGRSWERKELLLCPMAARPKSTGDPRFEVEGDTFSAWQTHIWEEPIPRPLHVGSYGWNYRTGEPVVVGLLDGRGIGPTEARAKAGATIPVYLDCMSDEMGPDRWREPPPAYECCVEVGVTAIGYSCINRHEGGVNCLFLDWSVRKVGLKELWTLKWNKGFDTRGPWTKAGGAKPEDWPEWMRKFKDY